MDITPFLRKLLCLTVGVVALMITVYLASPLFISTEINEQFPANSASSISFEKYNKMVRKKGSEPQRT